jgi:hypothetical protein
MQGCKQTELFFWRVSRGATHQLVVESAAS